MADISKIKLPSGNEYDIKDAVAREMISGGISFIIAWTATDYAASSAPSAAKLATIPAGAEVAYNNGASTATGTLTAGADTKAKFYLIYSKTQAGNLDTYNEYVTVEDGNTYLWEKIGDTQIDLSNVVTDVTLNKQTDTAIGTSATFTITQPTIALATDSSSGTGKVQVVTGINSVTNPTVALSAESSSSTGRTQYVQSVSTTKLSATANITGKTSSAASSVTPTTKKLATTTVTGVSGSTSITPVESRSSQTTATGAGTASTTNTDWLKSISVSNEVLTIGAATLNTQTTYSAGAPRASLSVPTAASATTVATGATTTSGSGADIVTDVAVGDTVTVVTAAPTITISSGSTGDVTVASGGTTKYMAAAASGTAVTPSQTYIKGSASGANTAWNSKDSVTVLTNATDISVTKGGN